MTSTRARHASVGLTLAVLVLAGGAACSDAGEGTGKVGAGEWPSTTTPVDTDGLIWATGNQVHLPDGTTIELEDEVGGFVVAGPGVWYTPAEADSEVELKVATVDGDSIDTSAHPYAIRTSSDGRWLAFLDQPADHYGPREAVVIDTSTGTELVRSSEGLVPGDTDDVDWTDLYEELPVDIYGITDDTAYVRGLEETIAYDLSTGESTILEQPAPGGGPAWLDDLRPEPPYWNPSHTWSIPEVPFEAVPQLRPESGEPVTTSFEIDPHAPPPMSGTPDLESWTLTGWLDDTTAVGLTSTIGDRDTLPVLITCTVPDGKCEVVPGTEEGVTLPADRPAGISDASRG